MAALAACRRGGPSNLVGKESAGGGKKLLATGNGRCNFTNMDLDPGHFHGSEPRFAGTVLNRFTGAANPGVFSRARGWSLAQEEAGKVFPASGQASSVLDVLRYQAEYEGVAMVCDTAVKSVAQKWDAVYSIYHRGFL